MTFLEFIELYLLVPMVVMSLVISGLTLAKTCWELAYVNIRENGFPQYLYPCWWTNLLVGGIWRFVGIMCQVVSIVFILLFFWIELLSKVKYGSMRFVHDSTYSFDHSSNESLIVPLDIGPYYVCVVPITILFIPFPVSMWAYNKYIGINDDFSMAYGFLSSVVPIR